MTRFIAFLRAINVGGRTLKKEKLSNSFIALSFKNVSTHKQSGNVIFDSDSDDPEFVRKILQERLPTLLGFKTVVFVRTMPQLQRIIELGSLVGRIEEHASLLVTFLSSSPSEHLPKFPILIPKSKAEMILFDGKEVFNVTHGHGDGAKPNPFIESKFKVPATTRNINIIKEIVKKFSESDKD